MSWKRCFATEEKEVGLHQCQIDIYLFQEALIHDERQTCSSPTEKGSFATHPIIKTKLDSYLQIIFTREGKRYRTITLKGTRKIHTYFKKK